MVISRPTKAHLLAGQLVEQPKALLLILTAPSFLPLEELAGHWISDPAGYTVITADMQSKLSPLPILAPIPSVLITSVKLVKPDFLSTSLSLELRR